ncbi:MAG: o-succinylbenzoate synthase, partial [Verrucomicrobia bacterium]|nr:o-succinylbenzoate synthase [Verrucomicrobiota bacterium]
FLLKIMSAGVLGVGDVAPLPGFSMETLPEARENVLSMNLQGRDVAIQALLSEAPDAPLAHALPSVRFGIECALLDIAAKRKIVIAGNPFDRQPGPVAVNALLTEPSCEAFQQLVKQGYTCIKIKVGRADWRRDVDFLESLSTHVRGSLSIRLDANRAWSLETAEAFICALPAFALAYIEEPCRRLEESLVLARCGDVRVALDESLIGMAESALARLSGVAAFVIKPTLCGGVCAAMRLARAAREGGAEPVISAAFESDVGLRALVYLADALMTPGVAAGLDTWRWMPTALCGSVVHSDGPEMRVTEVGAGT